MIHLLCGRCGKQNADRQTITVCEMAMTDMDRIYLTVRLQQQQQITDRLARDGWPYHFPTSVLVDAIVEGICLYDANRKADGKL